MNKNHYEELGVAENASAVDIKQAYRQKATETHPDKGGDAAQFARVARAYAVLSDPKSKAHYDATGTDGQPPFDVAVQNRLLSVFNNVLQDPDDIEIVAAVRRCFEGGLEKIGAEREKAKIRMKTLKARRGKVKTTDAVNLVHLIIDKELTALTAGLDEMKFEEDVAKACLKNLKTYSEQVIPKSAVMYQVVFSGGGSTTSGW